MWFKYNIFKAMTTKYWIKNNSKHQKNTKVIIIVMNKSILEFICNTREIIWTIISDVQRPSRIQFRKALMPSKNGRKQWTMVPHNVKFVKITEFSHWKNVGEYYVNSRHKRHHLKPFVTAYEGWYLASSCIGNYWLLRGKVLDAIERE